MQHLEVVPSFVAQLDGKILPNARAVLDVDGDDVHDLVFGSMNGTIAVFKISPERLVKWKECKVQGCVTAICADSNMPNDMQIFVATADGVCYVIQGTESGDDFSPSAEFRVALNVSDVTLHRGFVVFGTREGTILVYVHDQNSFGGHKLVHTHDLGTEIETFLALSSSVSSEAPMLLVRSASGDLFEVQLSADGYVSASTWTPPRSSPGFGSVPYIVDGVKSSALDDDGVVCGSQTGHLELLSQSGEIVWNHEVPEAIVGVDRLRISDAEDVIVVCTWSGELYVIQDSVRIAHFRMLFPASSLFCADVTMAAAAQPERMLITISTSGVISMYKGLRQALYHALQTKTLAHALDESSSGKSVDTEEKRRAILKALLDKADQYDASDISALLSKDTVAISDLICVATSQPW